MKPMRVLQVLDYINHNSGVSAVVTNYYFHMSHENVQFDFLLFEKAEENLEKQLLEQGARIYTTGQPSGRNIRNYWKVVDRFFEQHASEYDIVHIHIPNAAFAVLGSARKHGIKVRILHSHNARGADGTIKKIRNFILNKWGKYYANQYFACSKAAAAYLFGKKATDCGQVCIVYNAIDLSKYSYMPTSRERIRSMLGVKDELLLGHIGRFSEQKNHMQLLEIFAEAVKRSAERGGRTYKLLLLGAGELREDVEKRAIELGVAEQVIFAGVVDNVEEYLSAMDVFLLPSLYEGLPVVCVEAQAAGLPCVISMSVTREVALTEQVTFIDRNEIVGWCDKIEELSGQRIDRNQRPQLEAYDIEVQAKCLEDIYLVGSRG